MTEYVILAKFVTSLFLGGVIWLERSFQKSPAGLRICMLVTASGTIFALLGVESISYLSSAYPDFVQSTDPARIVHAIIVGVSFLGAGTILKDSSEDHVRHLSTAATLLISAGIGMSVAFDRYVFAISATCILLFVNIGVNHFETWLHQKTKKHFWK